VIEKDRESERMGEQQEISERPEAPDTSAERPASENIRNVSFSTAVRGYDRREVDRYVQRVNRLIAELEISHSPESAVRHALDRVGEQTSGILQRARETADEIIHTAGSEADETTARGRAEAKEVVAEAQAKADRTLAEAEEHARERVERGRIELEALRKQGEETHTAAEAAIAHANSEASELVAEANREADQILARADAEIAERRAQEKERLDALRRDAEELMSALRADTDTIEDERRRVFEEIHELAMRLEQLIDSREGSEATPAALDDGEATAGEHPESGAGGDDSAIPNDREPAPQGEQTVPSDGAL
jgi:DivIVA domain-containing protein